MAVHDVTAEARAWFGMTTDAAPGPDERMPVKAVVVYKWARNPADAVVRTDGSIDWRNAKMAAGEDDPAALAVAKQVASTLTGR